jgi:hypothetical protein
MKLSHILSAAGILIFAGCGARGGVEFDYVLLFDNVGEIAAAENCAAVGIDTVRFAVGNDLNGDGILDDTEEIDAFEQFCDQNDDNGDGIIDAAEFGKVLVNRVLDADVYDSFSISFLDAAGNFVLWAQAPVPGAQTFTFQGGNGTVISKNDITFLPFVGDGAQVADELQVFVDF